MRGVLELLTRVGARKHANLPADSGIPPGLQVERRVSHAGYLVDAGLAGRFDSAENQIGRRGPWETSSPQMTAAILGIVLWRLAG